MLPFMKLNQIKSNIENEKMNKLKKTQNESRKKEEFQRYLY